MPKPIQMLSPKQKFELYQMREAGISMLECQLWFKCSKATLDRAMRELRAVKGIERVKQRGQYSRAHLARVRTEGTEA